MAFLRLSNHGPGIVTTTLPGQECRDGWLFVAHDTRHPLGKCAGCDMCHSLTQAKWHTQHDTRIFSAGSFRYTGSVRKDPAGRMDERALDGLRAAGSRAPE